ncbi:MAG: bacterial Ig-like domain-containing protein [Acholeplasmataceae bacterium]
MRKKILSLITILVLVFTISIISVSAEGAILGETLVYKYSYVEDLPTQYVKGSEIEFYEYDGEQIPDFRHYFEVYDNAQTILNMHSVGGAIDLGGYTWDMNFDINTVGTYQVTLSYTGVTGSRSETIELEVIEEDIEGPTINLVGGNFNKIRVENRDEFLAEFNQYLRRARVYDSVDGVIKVTIDDFDVDDIENLRTADLRANVDITLTVEDKAGNEATKTVTLTIVDLKAPNIHNVRTLTTQKGRRINLTNHLRFSDNYSDEAEIKNNAVYEIYSTLVVKNTWESGPRRAKPSDGEQIKNYLRLTNAGLDSFLTYVETNYPTVHVVGDYYEIKDNNQMHYVYIARKEAVEGSEVDTNVWEITTNKALATGRKLESFETFEMSEAELLDYAMVENEEGFRVNDYYQTLDLTTNKKYFVYIKETENVYRDKHEQPTINFNKVGVYYVKVNVADEYGNTASAVYRVVVADGLSFTESILIVNGVVLGVAAIGVVMYIVFRRRK